MRQKVIILITAIAALLALSGCGESYPLEKKIPLDKYLIANAVELTETIEAKADPEIIGIYSASDGVLDKAKNYENLGNPDAAFVITVPEDGMAELIEDVMGADIPDEIYDNAINSFTGALVSYFNSTTGSVESIAAASILAVGSLHRNHSEFANTTYILLYYGDMYAVVVSYSKSNLPDVLSVQASPFFLNEIFEEALNGDISGELEDYLDNYGVKYKEYSKSEVSDLLK